MPLCVPLCVCACVCVHVRALFPCFLPSRLNVLYQKGSLERS